MTQRSIDHLVLPTPDLDVARARLGALGFTVASEGLHPFGTKNACVYFADDTFLEPLAIADIALADQAVAIGNVFVSRDRVFRGNRGSDGFSAVVMTSDDADADHESFLAEGVSAGPRLDFSRAYVDAGGESRSVSFRLAFAAPSTVDDTFFFTCERVDAPVGGRGALAVHANGVKGLSRVVASADDPRQMASFLALLSGAQVDMDSKSVTVEAANAAISVLSPAAITKLLGTPPPTETGLALCGIVFAIENLAVTAAFLDANGVSFARADERLVVEPAPGQGAFFAFEETTS